MSLIQQELQDLKIQLESEGKHKHVAGETKIIRKIDFLKEQFRELLVESRQRRAAEQENAMILSEDDPVNYSSVKCFLLIRLSLVTTCGKTSVATVPWSFEITRTHIRPLWHILIAAYHTKKKLRGRKSSNTLSAMWIIKFSTKKI